MFLIIVEKEKMQATTVTVGGIFLYNIVNFSSVNELYKNTFVIAWFTLANCFGQMIHDFATPVCLCGLYYKSLMIIIYDRIDFASTIKLGLWL